MKQIDTKEWKEFVITDFFEIQTISNKLSKLDIDDDGTVSVQSSETLNNGIFGYTKREPEFYVAENEFYLIFGDHTKSINIADYDFCVMDNVKVLKPKVSNKLVVLFISTVWKKAIPELGYARHWGVAKNTKFRLPVDEIGNPDFNNMEAFMKKIEFSVNEKINAFQKKDVHI